MKVVDKSFAMDLLEGDAGRLWFDIECYKVDIDIFPKDWPDGAGKRRFKTFMIGICYYDTADGALRIALFEGDDEEELLKEFCEIVKGSYELAYLSRNRFDEVVLEGRWTTARRKRLESPGPWPSVLKINPDWPYDWVQLRLPYPEIFDRSGEDINWKAFFKKGGPDWSDKEEINMLRRHLFRDVVGLALSDPSYKFDEIDVNRVIEEVNYFLG